MKRRLAMVVMITPVLASCTIDTATEPAEVVTTTTATKVQSEERYLTETVVTTIAESTVTETETRWAIGDPAEVGVENQRLFGPYPNEDVCLPYPDATCEEREDGWYLVVDPEPVEPSGPLFQDPEDEAPEPDPDARESEDPTPAD